MDAPELGTDIAGMKGVIHIKADFSKASCRFLNEPRLQKVQIAKPTSTRCDFLVDVPYHLMRSGFRIGLVS